MAKANVKANLAAKEEKLITLTREQFAKLIEIHSMLDNASDTLGSIDGDENAFAIGRLVGDACSDIINAYNNLGDIIDDKKEEIFLDSIDFEDEN
jgi:hypothetical protein